MAASTAKTELLVLLASRRTSGVGRRMESLLAQLQIRARGQLRIGTFDADERPELARRLGVREIPSVVVVKDRRPVAVLGGRVTFAEIERAVTPHIESEAA